MTWIELHQSVVTHRRTLDLSDELGVPVVVAVGHLACLWLWAVDNAPGGDVSEIKPRTLSRAAMWEGDPEAFVAALRTAGYIDRNGCLHDWDDYAGRLVDQRARNAEKQRRWRDAHKPVTSLPINNVRDGDVAVTSPSRTAATVPNPTVPYLTLPNQHSTTAETVEIAPVAHAPDALALTNGKLSRARDPIFDAFLSIFAGGDDAFLSDPQRAKWNVAAAGFRKLAARKGHSCEEMAEWIHTAHGHWPNVMGQLTETPNALLTHFASLLVGPQVNGRSNGVVQTHRQTVDEYARVNRGPKRGVEAIDPDWKLSEHVDELK